MSTDDRTMDDAQVTAMLATYRVLNHLVKTSQSDPEINGVVCGALAAAITAQFKIIIDTQENLDRIMTIIRRTVDTWENWKIEN
jgi:hypothetical protein